MISKKNEGDFAPHTNNFVRSFKGIRSIFSKGIISVFDQFIYSGTNFVINLILARYLTISNYGIFGTAYGTYLFMFGINHAFILEPLNIIAIKYYSNMRLKYLYSLIIIQVFITFLFSFILLLISFLFIETNNEMSISLLYLAIFSPFMIIFYTLKRICYSFFKQLYSFYGSLIYVFLLVLFFFYLNSYDTINVQNSFVIMGVASLISSFFIFSFLKYILKNESQDRKPQIIDVINHHWRLGKWLLFTAGIGWLSINIYVPIIGYLGKLNTAASLKTLENFLLPLEQLLTAISVFVIPYIINSYSKIKSLKYVRTITTKLVLAVLLFLVVIILIFYFFSNDLFEILYDNEVYEKSSFLLPFICLILIFRTIRDLKFGVIIRILEKFKYLMVPTLFSSLFSLTIGLVLLWQYDMIGAVIAKILTSFITMIILYKFYLKVRMESA